MLGQVDGKLGIHGRLAGLRQIARHAIHAFGADAVLGAVHLDGVQLHEVVAALHVESHGIDAEGARAEDPAEPPEPTGSRQGTRAAGPHRPGS